MRAILLCFVRFFFEKFKNEKGQFHKFEKLLKIFLRIEFTNWKLVATWLAHSKYFLAFKAQLKGL